MRLLVTGGCGFIGSVRNQNAQQYDWSVIAEKYAKVYETN